MSLKERNVKQLNVSKIDDYDADCLGDEITLNKNKNTTNTYFIINNLKTLF